MLMWYDEQDDYQIVLLSLNLTGELLLLDGVMRQKIIILCVLDIVSSYTTSRSAIFVGSSSKQKEIQQFRIPIFLFGVQPEPDLV